MKTLLKLLMAALLVHGTWRAGSAYLRYYRFKEGVQEAAKYSSGQSESDLQNRVFELAGEFHVPLAPENIAVRHEENRTLIDAEYTESIEIVPTYLYPWEFRVNVDEFTIVISRK